MKFRPYTGITWSLLELAGLLEDEDSHVHFERMKKHLGLHPFHMNDLGAALNEILSSGLNAYDSELQGFLLAYKNPKLLTPLGDIFYDSCFIHIDIEADFYVFRPKIGHLLKGVIHKKGANYIGVLMHKAFNVSIPKPENVENWPGDTVNIGQEVRFKVTNLDFTSRLPFIRGILNEADYLEGCKIPAHVSSNGTFYEINESDDSDNSNVEVRRSAKKKKKLKEMKKKVSSEEHLTKKKSLDNQDTEDEENKKHSKKSLTKSEESNNEAEQDEHLNISNNNVSYLNGDETSVKKKKKHEKSLKRKFKEISESELDCSNVRIKVERDTSTTDTETESKKHIKKSKKHSKKLKYSIDANGSIDNEIQEDVRLESGKHSENEFKTPIKLEKLSKSNNIKEESASHKSKSPKKRIKRSLTDLESEFDSVEIKVEDSSETEYTQPYDDEEQKVKIKTEKSMLNKETDNENSLSGSAKKHKRKRAKTLEVEQEYENVTIKKEKLDDYSLDYTSPSKKSSKNKYSIDHNTNDEYDTQHEINVKKSHKKSKVKVNLESESQGTEVKTENVR
ncbi:DNA-directed RNA polymerase I subunit RPA43 [Vespula squamosa]|uniref:DNA-directed RNA polymerase I subunit RPA43 n=1 Tax=Vespula squamosa TaxID=30214 RepID=A0ABD2B826_VESSQ